MMGDEVSGKPVVSFSGQGPLSRSEYVEQAVAAGWIVWGKARAGVDVLVVGEAYSAAKVAVATNVGTKVMTYDQWSNAVETGAV